MRNRNLCRHCGAGVVKSWQELTDDEQKVVERLPAAKDYSREERKRTHHWCTRCWQETENDEAIA
jgi:hypothetical protein